MLFGRHSGLGHTLSCAYDPHFWHLNRHHIVVAKFKLSISAFRFLYIRSISAASSPVSTFERSGIFISLDGQLHLKWHLSHSIMCCLQELCMRYFASSHGL